MGRETLKSLREVFSGIAFRKSEATAYRARGKPEGAEDARDVYLSACASIARQYEGLGYRYAKSGPHFSRTEGEFTYKISFQSSHHNIPGRHVRLWLHATVHSKKLKEWRKGHLSGNFINDYVAGGMAHRLLGGEAAMVEWELANPQERPVAIEGVKGFLDAQVLPYFAQFGTPAQLINILAERSVRAFDLRPSVEFGLCFGDRQAGQRILSRFMAERPDLAHEIAKVQKAGFKHPHLGPSGYAEEVVYFQGEHGLK